MRNGKGAKVRPVSEDMAKELWKRTLNGEKAQRTTTIKGYRSARQDLPMKSGSEGQVWYYRCGKNC